MKIEFLFPELVTLYGETGNLKLLRHCLPGAELVQTHHGQCPAFVNGDVDFVYIGSMIDNYQGIAIEALRPYLYDLRQYIAANKIFLATGNAIDLFGEYIDWGTREEEGLGLFDFYSKGDIRKHHNSWFLGEFEDMKIVANRSTFTREYGAEGEAFLHVLGGEGMNEKCDYDGVRRQNFYATSLLGPFLVLNPPFMKYLLRQISADLSLWQEEALMEAYENRLKILSRPQEKFIMGALG